MTTLLFKLFVGASALTLVWLSVHKVQRHRRIFHFHNEL